MSTSIANRITWQKAVRYSDLHILRKMLRNNFDINAKFEKGRTSLMTAVMLGNVAVVKLFLWTSTGKQRCLLDSQDDDERTALMYACESNNLEIMALLLKNGANVHLTDKSNENALVAAVRRGSLSAVKLAIKAGCRLDLVSANSGMCPLAVAITCGETEICLELIKSKCYINQQNCHGHTPLMLCAMNSNYPVFDALIAAGCDVNMMCPHNGYNALHIAIKCGLTKFALRLIGVATKKTHCPEVNNITCYDMATLDGQGLTPLMLACALPDTTIFEALLKAGADVCKTAFDGKSLLDLVVQMRNLNKLKILFRLAMHPIFVDSSALLSSYALYLNCGDYTMVRELVIRGRRVTGCEDVCNFAPYACKNSRSCTNLLHMAVERNDVEFVTAILKATDSVNLESVCLYNHQSPLMIACSNGFSALVKLLVDAGVNVNTIVQHDGSSMSPIHYAAAHGDVQSVQALVEAGASVTKARYECVNGWTLLHFAARYGHTGLTSFIVNQLDCNLNACDQIGDTPLDLSLNYLHGGVTSILVDAGARHVGRLKNRVWLKIGQYRRKSRGRNSLCTLTKNNEVLHLVRDAKAEPLNTAEVRRLLPHARTSSQSSSPSSALSIDQQYKVKVPIGLAIILNNKTFESCNMDDRHGSQVDLEKTVKTLSSLGFQTHVYKDLTADQLIGCFQHYGDLDLSQYSSLIGVVMSHGRRGHIYGTDGNSVPVIHLTSKFKSASCPSLSGKPKCFIVVACQSDEPGVAKHDLIPVEEQDYIVAYSTMPGAPSYRTTEGTHFMHKLMSNLDKYAHLRPLPDILQNTIKHITIQTPLVFTSLQKKFMLRANMAGEHHGARIPRFNKDNILVTVPVQPSDSVDDDSEPDYDDTMAKELVQSQSSSSTSHIVSTGEEAKTSCGTCSTDVANLSDFDSM